MKLPQFHKHFELIGKEYQIITEGRINVLATIKKCRSLDIEEPPLRVLMSNILKVVETLMKQYDEVISFSTSLRTHH